MHQPVFMDHSSYLNEFLTISPLIFAMIIVFYLYDIKSVSPAIEVHFKEKNINKANKKVYILQCI